MVFNVFYGVGVVGVVIGVFLWVVEFDYWVMVLLMLGGGMYVGFEGWF